MCKYFLSPKDAIHLNAMILDAPSALLSLPLLESALHQPYNGYYESIYAQAAGIFRSLLMNHCFKDGNKRTACALLAIFLQETNLDLPANDKSIEEFTLSIIRHPKESQIKYIEQWLETNTMDYI